LISKLLDRLFGRALRAQSFGSAFRRLWLDLLYVILASTLGRILLSLTLPPLFLGPFTQLFLQILWVFLSPAVLIPDAAVLGLPLQTGTSL